MFSSNRSTAANLFLGRDDCFARAVRRRLHPGRALPLGARGRSAARSCVDWASPPLRLQLTLLLRQAPSRTLADGLAGRLICLSLCRCAQQQRRQTRGYGQPSHPQPSARSMSDNDTGGDTFREITSAREMLGRAAATPTDHEQNARTRPVGAGFIREIVATSNRRFIDGGGGRTRTFEAIRRLIYSQLPLPLGTLPRSTLSAPHHRNGGGTAIDEVETRAPDRELRSARL